MRNNFLLINETDIKGFSVVGNNLDSKYIAPSIIAVQDVYLEPMIGSRLIQKLGELIENGDIELPDFAIYKELLDTYIQPYLLNKTISEIQIQIFSKIRNAGVVQYTDTNQTTLQIQDLNYMRKHYDDIALVYSDRMTDFLKKNRNAIPEYQPCACSNGGDVNAGGDEANNFCSIHF